MGNKYRTRTNPGSYKPEELRDGYAIYVTDADKPVAYTEGKPELLSALSALAEAICESGMIIPDGVAHLVDTALAKAEGKK